uniref:Protein Wnt n=1 Tax=Plectus sambesii TaxID=2011161 RepID=A0A914VDE6_9BILA
MRWSVTVVLLPSALLLRLLLLLLVSPTHTFEPKWWRLYWYNPEKHAVHHFEPFLSDGMYRRFVQDPAYLPVVAGALREAFQLCRFHMQGQHYWNCPIVGKGSGEPLFGKMTAQSNRESAFLFALTTAAVVRAVARACSAGQLSDCSCDPEKRGPVHSLSGHTWRPCDIEGGSDNLNFANKFSKRLIDRFESCN